jgi:protein O-GlcNAc transferase
MQPETSGLRPRIRILHQLARSGGTVICRCLASMESVVLLSEIHPQGLRMFNPLQQAIEWYGLLRPADVARAETGKLSFNAAIAMIAERCAEQDKILVLRDWNHLDYIGLPFAQPGYRPLLADSLHAEFELIRFATVRHPLDQWLSLSRNPLFAERLPPGKYLKGVRRFAEMASGTGMLHYEDFTASPDDALLRLCTALQIPFDPAYRQRWASYNNITGDVLPGRSEAGEIKSLPRQDRAAEVQQAFEARADYQRILNLMNYTALG